MLQVEHREDLTLIKTRLRWAGIDIFDTVVYEMDGLLIDCGPKSLHRELVSVYRDMPVTELMLTHHHEDHSGLAAWLHHNKGIIPRIHPLGVELLQQRYPIPLYRRAVWQTPPPVPAEPLGDSFYWQGRRIEVIHTPGHARDHVAFWDSQRGRLFSGDLYMGKRLIIAGRWERINLLVDSLRRVLALDFNTVCCAHTGIIDNGKEALRCKLEYILNLQGEAKHLSRQGIPVKVIAQRLLGNPGLIELASMGEFSRVHLIKGLLEVEEI